MWGKVLLVLLVLMLACRSEPPAPLVRVDTVLVVDSACRDSLRTERVLIDLTEQQMLRYAGIVRRDPSQSKFLVGWTRRAFAR